MTDILDALPALIEQGQAFTYENFSAKSARGYPIAYSADWLVWVHQVNQVVREIGQSPATNSIARGTQVEMLGNDEDEFQTAKALIVSGLTAALKISGKDIPAADRVVTLGHNSPERNAILSNIDELVSSVEKANDFPGSDEDKEQVVAELSAARRLFEAGRVRVTAVKAALQPTLRWIAEKCAGAMIGKLAGNLIDYLVSLHFF